MAALPLLPELYLWLGSRSDLKYYAPICYYECIVSFVLLAPTLVLPRLAARIWALAVGGAFAVATMMVGFYAACYGARWNLAAHTALMETNHHQAWDFTRNFLSPGLVAMLVVLAVAFGFCLALVARSARPNPRFRRWLIVAGLVLCAHGIYSSIRFGGALTRRVTLSQGRSIRFVDAGYGKLHPVTLLLMVEFNYVTTSRYYLGQYRATMRHLGELAGARTIPGAVPPRIIVVVIGESASRHHWSLYGYPLKTTPRLDALRPQLAVFPDVVSTCVSTVYSLHDMFTTPGESIPIFPLFSQAGYSTHWFSAQFNLSGGDLMINAMVSSCQERVYLDGVYDENLEPLLARVIAKPGRHMVFLHLFGSHVRYADRYPARFNQFRTTDGLSALRASYDNSILYTDKVLGDVIGMLQRLHEPTCLLHVSDHAEDVLDSRPDKYLFRDESLATDPMYEVPFIVWVSPEYRLGNPDFVRDGLSRAQGRPFQDRQLYNCLIDLARLRHPLYDPKAALFSGDFKARVRRVGIEGRVYRGPDRGK